MSGEWADDSAILDAMGQEVLNEISASRVSYQAKSDTMHEPWGGHFRQKQKPPLALSETGEA